MLDRAIYSSAIFFNNYSGQQEKLHLFLDTDGIYRWYVRGSDWIDTEIYGKSVDEAQTNLSECGIDVQID